MSKDFYLTKIENSEGFEALRIIADFARVDGNLCGAEYQEVTSKLYLKINEIQLRGLKSHA